MSKIQNALIPSFLKRLDFWLLTHKPHIWRTRGHFVVFYGTITAVLFFIFGLVYPFSLFELQERLSYSSNVNVAFTVMSFFLVLGGLFLWWFSIQKYAYKRTNLKHFFIEIGIYTVGCFTLWTVLLAFSMGFDYKKCNLLEKNTPEDKEWFNQHSFPEFGYMPHVDPNKLADLNKYFSNGEKLIAIQWNRAKSTEPYRQYTDNKYYSFIDEGFQTHLHSLDWEYKTLIKNPLPPQYKKVSDYVNLLIGNDSLRLSVVKSLEHVRQNEDENIVVEHSPSSEHNYELLFDKIIAGLDYNGIVELTENTYPRFYHHINFASHGNSFLNRQVSDWTNQRTFLESLNPQELIVYKDYLSNLFEYYKDYRSKVHAIKQLQYVAYQSFFNHTDREVKDSLDIDEYNLPPPPPDNAPIGNEYNNAIAGERLKTLLTFFDLDSKKKYVYFLAKMDDDVYFKNTNHPIAPQIVDKTYSTLKATSLDSLLLYDYYYLNIKNYSNYRAFFTNAYTDYVAKKYTLQDFDRLHNLLTVNGFPEEPSSQLIGQQASYKDSKLQKIALLFYSEKYRKAINDLEDQRNSVKNSLAFKWSPFSVLYCLLAALVFYVMTLSTGIQFWISVFLSGLYWAIMLFFSELARMRRYSERDFNNTSSLPFYFMLIHVFIFSVLILYLLNRKYQAQRAHLVVNTVLISGVGSVMATTIYWLETIKDWYYSRNNPSMNDVDTIRIISNVLLGAILLYGVIAWLFKRHLTYPKKR